MSPEQDRQSREAGSATAGPVVVRIPNGQLDQNCYLVADPASGEAVMIDPGEEIERLLAEVARRGWTLSAVWLTHGHVDHILGVQAVKDAHGVPVHLHPADRPIYDALPQFGAWFGRPLAVPPAPDAALAHDQRVRVGAYEFAVRHTPGHSPGSVAFVGHGHVFGGDVLFAGSVGRTDLPGGDTATLLRTIHDQFLTLPDATIVHSGHGPDTTIGVERATNPFLTGAYGLG